MGWSALRARVIHNTRMGMGFQQVYRRPLAAGEEGTAEDAEDAEGGSQGRSPSREEMR